jgi:prepilin peptidase CpaA
MIVAAIFVIVPLCLAVAALSDLFTMTIPNRASLIIAVSFILIAPFTGMPLQAIGLHILAGLIVFCVCFTLFAINVMGGGDAKLLAATAIWFGLDHPLLLFLTYVGLVGGVATLLILVVRTQSDMITAVGLRVPKSILYAKKIPYGIAIAIGGFMAFPSSPLLIAAVEGLK